jgi:hypothetical protein
MITTLQKHRKRTPFMLYSVTLALLGILFFLPPAILTAGGSRALYPLDHPGSRANLEWRTSTYAGSIPRRTIFNVYLRTNEYLLLGSSAINANPGRSPNLGDVRVYNPDVNIGPVASEVFPAGANFSCADAGAAAGNPDLGRIANRQQELAGPNTNDNQVPAGYTPCVYQAPMDGVYRVVFYGPYGGNSDADIPPSARVEAADADFDVRQATSITAWDITIRNDLNSTAEIIGRTFAYYVAMYTGGNGRNVQIQGFVASNDGFIYRYEFDSDPNGFLIYSNQLGFLDTDGTPLYRNVMSVDDRPTQQQNQLVELQGGVGVAPPEHPIFLNPPDPIVLSALGIPTNPITPTIFGLNFTGTLSGSTSLVEEGGTFNFRSGSSGIYLVVISQDGVNFDPEAPANRSLRGVITDTLDLTVAWDGRNNEGAFFPVGEYVARAYVQGGEVHFPFLDIENNINGGPRITLTNPPGACPPWQGGCSGAFYDDRGYRTANGALVGVSLNGPLCPGNTGNPPVVSYSDPFTGFDSSADPPQRSYGFLRAGNPEAICLASSGFGDKKGLDIWTFYPSNVITTPLRLVEPSAITLLDLQATRASNGVTVNWETGSERDSAGFHLFRASSANRSEAVRITTTLIPARGSASQGARYTWPDTTATDGDSYHYWLQEYEIGSGRNEYGPVLISARSLTTSQNTYLPIVR